MKHLRRLAFVLALVLVTVACGDDDTTATSTTTAGATTTTAAAVTTTAGGLDPAGPMVRFSSGDHPFSISSPEDWESEPDHFGAVIFFFSPFTSSSDFFRENVNVVVEDLGGADLDLDEYLELATEQLFDSIPDIDLVDRFSDRMDEELSWVIVYTGSQEDGEEYQWMQEIAVFDGSAYIITYTGKDEFDLYLTDAVAIFDSFEFDD